MKLLTFVCLILTLGTLQVLANDIPTELQSRLDKKQFLNERFGEVKYRAPLIDSEGPTLVLLHGIYAGSTHMAWREILPFLDAKARVYLVDLYGTGENAPSEKRVYSLEDLDEFVEAFLENIVLEPSFLISESLLGASAQVVAAKRPDLVDGLILLSPTGINSLAALNESQDNLYKRLYKNDWIGTLFYRALFTRISLSYFLKKTVYDDSLITDERILESKVAGKIKNQKWISLSFVGGQLYRPFNFASKNVDVPALMIFGAEAESVASDESLLEKPEDFLNQRPDYKLEIIEKAGASVQREKPRETAEAIFNFIN